MWCEPGGKKVGTSLIICEIFLTQWGRVPRISGSRDLANMPGPPRICGNCRKCVQKTFSVALHTCGGHTDMFAMTRQAG